MMSTEDKTSLTVQRGTGPGETLPIQGIPVMLGRGSDNDVDLDDDSVSRRHALIVGTPDGFILRDLHSDKGT